MIITLSGANFSSSNIGNLGNSGPFDVTVSCSNVSGASVSLNGGGKSASGTGSAKLTGVPSGTSVTYTISASGYNTASGTINVSFSNVTRSISLTAVGSVTPPVNPDQPGTGGGSNTVTWEIGPLNADNGTNNDTAADSIKKARVRTKYWLKLETDLTITVSNDTEICPVYVNSSGVTSSPNAYQTTPITVSKTQYAGIRLMIRKKSAPSTVLTTDFGNNVTITGSFTEVSTKPGSGSGSGSGSGTTAQPPKLSDTLSWTVSAINSNDGTVTESMTTRLYSNRFPLTSSPLTVTVSGDAEFCPFWYNEDGSLKSTPAVYQTKTLTTTVADGHSFCVMVRNKRNTSQTLTVDFGSNVTITK